MSLEPTPNGWRAAGELEQPGRAQGGLARAELVGQGLVSDSESDDSEDASGSEQEEEPSWVSWFCSLRGNEFFCEVDEDYIEDDFNLSGLSSQVPYYEYALDMILDHDPPHDVMLTDQQQELLESAAEMLYGLIHARYILTARGLASMLEKFKNCDFGRCPRVLCDGQPCLPVGTSDIPGQSTIKVFCPKCEDIFYPRSEFQSSIDGAYFGTTFPHLMLMTYPAYRPPKNTAAYVPRVFGFRLHKTAISRAEEAPQRPNARATPTDTAPPEISSQRTNEQNKKKDDSL
mmetsp:Transcript_11704/g.20791  ORF Transcript_11704/g.20791 Transcript_11704/m.20791 type:complete len:288 (+) Transcript_11704:208-1071(+)